MDGGVDGSGDPFSVGHALWTERPEDVQKSHGSLVPGHRAHRRSDAADRWREALWGLLFELCSEALRPGKRGRPKKTLPKGVKVRIKNKGSPRHKRGPKRPTYQAPYPEHPDTPQPMATTAIHANHLEAFHTSLRRRCAAYRRRTNMYAKKTGRLQERLDVYWIVHNFVRVHFTTRQVPAVALGILDHGFALHELFLIQKAA